MADSGKGQRLPLPRSRALTIDVLHQTRKVPTCAHERIFDLSRLEPLRHSQPRRIAWALLFIKAFGLVAQANPQLRQTYMRWPSPHLYEHPSSVAMLALSRQFRNEPWLFWARFVQPENQPLLKLQQNLDRYQTEPVEETFQRQFLLSGFPTPVRRLLWWWTLNVSGQKRAKRAGTVFLTTLARQQTIIQHPPAFLTANMTYGPLDDKGRCRVIIAYDHRLMDGSYIADRLIDLESVLNGPIAAELEQLAAPTKAA